MTSLHPGPFHSINSSHFGSLLPVAFRPLTHTHQNSLFLKNGLQISHWRPRGWRFFCSRRSLQAPSSYNTCSSPSNKTSTCFLERPEVPNGGDARLHWLLDINQQFFAWELQQIVSILHFTVFYFGESL